MTDDRIEGAVREGVGHVQDAVGGLVGDEGMQIKGGLNSRCGISGARPAAGPRRGGEPIQRALWRVRDFPAEAPPRSPLSEWASALALMLGLLGRREPRLEHPAGGVVGLRDKQSPPTTAGAWPVGPGSRGRRCGREPVTGTTPNARTPSPSGSARSARPNGRYAALSEQVLDVAPGQRAKGLFMGAIIVVARHLATPFGLTKPG